MATGSIQGSVTDPSSAVVTGAKITITNKATGQELTTTTTSSGTYSSGALSPGQYVVRVGAQGFKTLDATIPVQVGVTASGNFKLQLGEASQIVEVQASELRVNTEQATVQGVINTQQIENLPINGRNFLDLAQLEPGVQIQDGGNFDPTKKGFSSISFGGRFGRTARIEVDGVDTSDETVGTTTQDIPQGAIQEFHIGESMLDLSTELTSSGSVNVVTKSGTNTYHGQGYYYFRDQALDANLPGASSPPFQRNQFGGSLGGAIMKNRLFFFVDAERTKQDFVQPVLAGPPFQSLAGGFSAPFREAEGIAKLDYELSKNYKMFYRFSYDQNSDFAAFEAIAFQPMNNTTHTRDHVVGLDFTTRNFTHNIRFGYMKFFNHIVTGVTTSTPFNPSSPIELAIGPDPLCLNTSGATPDVFCSGQPFLAPQATPQSNHQLKYDGGRALGAHILRYGGGFNHIQGGGFAGFLADGPAVNASATACSGACLTMPGGAANALNYPTTFVLLGNGQGFGTEKAAFGFPAGGLGPDNRFYWYMGDSWKVKRYANLQFSYALSRYVSEAQDSDFINSAWNYANPNQYIGPNGLDRTHQISFGGTMEFPAHFRASLIGHFYSALPQTLTLAPTGAPGGIFVTAVNGDGTGDGNTANGSNGPVGSILPDTNLGSYGRSINGGNINSVIDNYNRNIAGNPTPAGRALVRNGLFTQAELQSLGGIMPLVNTAPANQANDGWLRALDASLNWAYKIKEQVELQPGVSFFNAMNFANFDAPKSTLSGVLSIAGQSPVVGTINGTPGRQPNSLRVGLGSGVFGLGSPRVIEFSLKLSF